MSVTVVCSIHDLFVRFSVDVSPGEEEEVEVEAEAEMEAKVRGRSSDLGLLSSITFNVSIDRFNTAMNVGGEPRDSG